MASRTTGHRLSGGLFVSGPLETKPKQKTTTPSTTAVPYTGGGIKKSGELGKMFEIPNTLDANTTGSGTASAVAATSRGHSGPLSRNPSLTVPKKSSSSSSSSYSGPLVLPATGLITSQPASGSGEQTPVRSGGGGGGGVKNKKGYGSAVTVMGKESQYEYAISTAVVLTAVLGLVVLLTLGVFLLVAVKNVVVLGFGCVVVIVVVVLVVWNWGWREKGLERFLRALPDTDLYGAATNQFVKVSGIVTCGSIPLETSYQCVPRCVLVSMELYEYRRWNGKQTNPNHRRLTWGLRHSVKHVADFYISDSRRGIRALVKAGHGSKIVSFVKPLHKLQINKENKEMHPKCTEWLENCNLSFDDHIIRLEEGYIKEGCTVTVIGILHRHENVIMIVPPLKPISTGCLWRKFLLSMNIKGLVLIGDEKPNDEVITV